MKSRKLSIAALIFVVVFIFSATNSTKAVELITNGGFETGTFAPWVASNSPSPWRGLAVTAAGAGGGFTSVGVTSVAPGGGTRNAWNGMTDNSTPNSTWNFYQQVTIPAGNSVTVSWSDRYQVNHTQFCPGGACQPKSYNVEITNTSGTVLQTLHTQTTTGNVNQNTGWVARSVLVSTLGGQTVRLRFRGTETTPLTGPGQVEVDLVSMNSVAPTAADGSVTGRVSLPSGRGISRATLRITDSQTGEVKTATTNPFGYYRFTELETGHFYILNVARKGYIFEPDSQSFQVNDNLEGINFIGSPPE